MRQHARLAKRLGLARRGKAPAREIDDHDVAFDREHIQAGQLRDRGSQPRRAPMILDQALAGAVTALQTMNPSARPATLTEVDTAKIELRPLPEGSRTAAFIITANGHEMFTRVSVYVHDGWTYKLRFTSPVQRANIIADISAVTFFVVSNAHFATGYFINLKIGGSPPD